MNMKYSRQRAAILSFLQSRRDHPTAETVYTSMKEAFPNISLGTVYRNLNQLAEAGMIAKHSFGVLSIDHFELQYQPHIIILCVSAAMRVIDLPMEHSGFASIDEAASEGFDGLIEEHRLYFCGICKSCLDKTSRQASYAVCQELSVTSV